LDLAWASPVAGAIFAVALLVIAAVCRGWPVEAGSPMTFLLPVLSILFGITGGLALLVSAVAFLRDLLRPRR
jgi:hypothetical protein